MTIRTRPSAAFCIVVAFALGLALFPRTTLASPPEAPAAGPGVSGRTVGHAQLGIALFDRSGTLASEKDQRGFAPWGGPTLRLGFVHYLAALPWLGVGAGVRGTFGNSSRGREEYFFNPIFTSATLAVFLPLGPRDSGFELQLDGGFTNILAKSIRASAAGNSVLHEYGIGPGVGVLAGYRWSLPRLGFGLTVSAQHSRHWVGVDVDQAAGKSWALGATTALLGASF